VGRPGSRFRIELDFSQEGPNEGPLLIHRPRPGHLVHLRGGREGSFGKLSRVVFVALLLKQRLLLLLQRRHLAPQLLDAPLHVLSAPPDSEQRDGEARHPRPTNGSSVIRGLAWGSHATGETIQGGE